MRKEKEITRAEISIMAWVIMVCILFVIFHG